MCNDHASAMTAPPPSHTTLMVLSKDFAEGDVRVQMTHIPASQSSHGRYPVKNESISLGNGTGVRALPQTAANARTSAIGTTLQKIIAGNTRRRVSVPAVRNETVQPIKKTRNIGLFN